MGRKTLLIGLLLFAALLIYHFVINTRRPIDFEVAENYVGEIRIKFDTPEAAPLPVKNGHYIAQFPPDGILKTSTVQDNGWGSDRYYYVSRAGKRTPIDGFQTNVDLIQNQVASTTERILFIGTRQQARQTFPPVVVENSQPVAPSKKQ